MGFVTSWLKLFGPLWFIAMAASVGATLVMIYLLVFYIIIPALHVVLPMLGFPG